MAETKRVWLAIGLIIALGIIIYANSLSNPFIWDDQALVVANPYIKDIHLSKHLFTKDISYGTQFSNFYRPLQSLSFMLDYYIWGLHPFGFHLTNLFLHIACALVLYFLFTSVFPSFKLVPLITALLFLVHPIQTEAVTYISGRADPLVGLFILLSIFFYTKKTKHIFYLFAAVISFILALLAKEAALILPLLILLYDVNFSPGTLRWRDKFKSGYWLFLLVALVYILLRSTVLNFIHRPLFLSDTSLTRRMLTSAKTFALYLGLLIFPFHLHMERSIPFVSSPLDKDVLCFLISLVLLAVLIIRNYHSLKFLFFTSLWFFLNLLPVSNLLPLNANMAEHWLYLASIGLFLLIALGIDRLSRISRAPKVLAIILAIIILASYSFLTIKRNRDWKDPESFFQTILYYSPQSAEAHNCLGIIYQAKGKLNLAITEFKEAVKLEPQNYKSYGNLGSALREVKDYPAAISAYKRAIELNPGIPGLYNNLGNIYADKGEWARAGAMFNQALKLYPEFALCRANLAGVYYKMGELELAISEYKKACALTPDVAWTHFNLGVIYFQKKNYSLAKENFLQALRLNPSYQPTRTLLKKIEDLGY